MPSITETTISKILEYNGKSVAPFRSAANELAIHPDALNITLEIAQQDNPTLQTGGTWILNSY